jgi:hypothetical protein
MARRLFLHIGTMKSATTYLQAMCDANAERLAQQGLLWPGAASCFGAVADLLGTRRPLIYGPRRTTWPALADRIAAHGGDALISNELLAARPRGRVRLLFESLPAAETRVVITARDLSRVVVSQWQERSRYGEADPWPEFMERLVADESHSDPQLSWFWRRQDLPRIVRVWGSRADHVAIVTVPPPGGPDRLIAERFFGLLGIDGVEQMTSPQHTRNQSLGLHSLELVRRIHQRVDDDERERLHLVLKYVLGRRVLAERRALEPTVTLTAEHVAWAQREARRASDELVEMGVDVVGDLSDLAPAEPPPAAAPEPTTTASMPTEAELLDVAIDAVIGVLRAADELAHGLGDERYGDAVRAIAGHGRPQP